jgi:succinylglutamate desuccinylase
MVNALTHGNELCGMTVVRRLLDAGVRPRAGRLTLSFANVAAYARFGPHALQSRFVDRDFNRLWHDDLLARDHTTVEARRAHAMAPLLRDVDRLLDLHSTWHAVLPFFVLSRLPRVRRWADWLALPPRQLLLPAFRHEGYHLIDYGGFADPHGGAIGLIAECGQHFAASSAQTAWQVTIRFLLACGCISEDDGARLAPDRPPVAGQVVERFEIVQPVMAATDCLRMTCSYAGFEQFQAGAVVAYDGETAVAAPFDDAVVLAPRPDPRAGQQAFAWGRRITD